MTKFFSTSTLSGLIFCPFCNYRTLLISISPLSSVFPLFFFQFSLFLFPFFLFFPQLKLSDISPSRCYYKCLSILGVWQRCHFWIPESYSIDSFELGLSLKHRHYSACLPTFLSVDRHTQYPFMPNVGLASVFR
jgi:hypothetical protein